MNTKDVQSIVITKLGLEPYHRPEAYNTGEQTDYDATHRPYPAAGRGNGHKSRNRTGSCSQKAGMATGYPLPRGPGERCSSGCKDRIEEGQTGKAVGFKI